MEAAFSIAPRMLRPCAASKFGGEGFARFRNAQEIGELLCGGENFIDVASVGGVGGYAEGIKSAEGVQAVDFLGDENEIGMERGDFLEIRIDGAADFSFLLSVGRVVAIVSVTHEAILESERVEGFRQAGRQRNDAANRLR